MKSETETETETESPSMSSLAREFMLANGNDVDLASAAMEGHVVSDVELYKLLTLPAFQLECRNNCRGIRSKMRQEATFIAGMSEDQKKGYLASIRHDWHTLMDFQLPDGTKLRDATRDMLNEAMAVYYKQARTMTIRRHWLVSVHRELPDDLKTVADVFTEEKLVKLYQFWQSKVK